MGPDVVALEPQDRRPGGEDRPEVIPQGVGKVVEPVKGREVKDVHEAGVFPPPQGHPGKNEYNGGEGIDDEGGADQTDGRGSAQQGVNVPRKRGQEAEIVQGADADRDEERQGPQPPAGPSLQATDLLPGFPAARIRFRPLFLAQGLR